MNALDLRVLDLVREQLHALGYSPEITWLAGRTGEARSTVHKAIDRLVDGGFLTRVRNKRRGLGLPPERDLRAVPTETLEIELGRRGVTFRALSRIEPMRPTRGAPCAATVCDQLVPRGRLFCYRHWCIIPRDLQQEILRAFGRGDAVSYEQAITRARDLIDDCGDGLRRVG